MAKDPAFLFYSKDWVEGTTILSFEDRGKFIHILSIMHQQGRLDEETICFIVGSVSVKLRAKFLIDEKGLWFNERLEKEAEKRNKFTESRISNGKKGGRPKTYDKPSGKPYGKAKNNLGVNANGDVNENVDIIINYAFAAFWDLYDKKVGNKESLEKKWAALTEEERETAMIHAPKYKESTPDKKFRKDPSTYLNNKSFKDEIITPMVVPSNGSIPTQNSNTHIKPASELNNVLKKYD